MAYIKPEKASLVYIDKLNIFHWKFLQQLEKLPGSIVAIIINFQLYHIFDCTIAEIHEANSKKMGHILEKNCSYKWNVLTCNSCDGLGALDWISNITKPKLTHSIFDSKLVYKRDPRGIIHKMTLIDGEHFFLSSPKTKRSYEICQKCLGTGINTIRNGVKKIEIV